MGAARLPDDENQRLGSLLSYNLRHETYHDKYDALASIAASIAGTPIATISLVYAEDQWFKGKFGLEACSTSRDVSFCAHAILDKKAEFIIKNALQDDRFKENDLVISGPEIRFYAGIPLVLNNGHAIGALCVIDRIEREIADEQIQSLKNLAKVVIQNIEQDKEILKQTLSAESFNSGLWSVDPSNEIFDFSQNARSILGYNNQSIPFLDYMQKNIHPDNKIDFFQEYEKLIRGSQKNLLCKFRINIDNEWRFISMNASSLKDDYDAVILIAGSVVDNTDLYKAKLQEQDNLENLIQETENLKNFAYTLTNDIQIPVRVINNFSALVSKHYADRLDNDAKEYINNIRSACIKLDKIIQASLSLTQIEFSKFYCDDINLNQLIQCLQNQMTPLITENKVQIFVKDLPQIYYPFEMIESIFSNLLKNAIQNSDPNKRATVTVDYKNKGNYYEFSVHDNGLGIPEEYHKSIFEPYKRLRINSKNKEMGFGLMIVSKTISYLGGEIWLSSKPNQGTTIYFTLLKSQQAIENIITNKAS